MTADACVHHFLIASPDGPWCQGVCKRMRAGDAVRKAHAAKRQLLQGGEA